MSLNRKMSDAHEAHLAEVFGGRVTPGSGNGYANPMDVRQSRYDGPVAFAFDGKSTRGKSISVTREMLDKAVEQSHGERPAIALRFYDDDRLKGHEDWVVVKEDDLVELLDRSQRLIPYEDVVERKHEVRKVKVIQQMKEITNNSGDVIWRGLADTIPALDYRLIPKGDAWHMRMWVEEVEVEVEI